MTTHTELQAFMDRWEHETKGTLALLKVLPHDQYDFQPYPAARSLGQLAWHLAELEVYASVGIERGEFKFPVKPPHSERPLTIGALLPAFRLAHADAVERISRLATGDLDREIPYADGSLRQIRALLWDKLLLHAVHHRGQLTLLCRIAGGIPPGLFGPTREEQAARRRRRASGTAEAKL